MKDISTKSLEGIEAISIIWDKNTSHIGVLGQVIDKLAAAGFSTHAEMIEEWKSILAIEDLTNQQ